MPPKKTSGSKGGRGGGDGLVFPVAAFILTGAFYFISAQMIVNNNFVVEKDVRQMVGLMYLSDVSYNLITGALSSFSSEGKKKAAKASKPLEGWPKMCLYCLPLLDCTALILTFEAIRMAGSGFQQTVGGASIPISCVLNVLITGKRYSSGQILGISLVMAGLAVKAKALLDGEMDFPLVPFIYVLCCNVCYALRGITMEYLSKVPNPPSGDRMTMQMGVTGLALWTLYTLAYTVPNLEELVLSPMRAAKMSTVNTVALYASHMLSRGLASKTIMMVVVRGGATVLSLSQVVRSSLIIVLSSVLFCGSNPRQCLDGVGIVSVLLVVSGGAVYGVAKQVDAPAAAGKKSTTRKKREKNSDDEDETVTEGVAASPVPSTATRRRSSAAATTTTAEKKSQPTKRLT